MANEHPGPLQRLCGVLRLNVGDLFAAGGSTGVEPYTHGSSEEILLVLSG
ncbi:hypothetical protein [Streptomyces sp. NPDC055794]